MFFETQVYYKLSFGNGKKLNLQHFCSKNLNLRTLRIWIKSGYKYKLQGVPACTCCFSKIRFKEERRFCSKNHLFKFTQRTFCLRQATRRYFCSKNLNLQTFRIFLGSNLGTTKSCKVWQPVSIALAKSGSKRKDAFAAEIIYLNSRKRHATVRYSF